MADSPRSPFKQAVRTNVSHEARIDAVDRLVELGDTNRLRTIVLTTGLAGSVRRHAVNGLGHCNGSETLTAIADDRSVEPILRRRAAELA